MTGLKLAQLLGQLCNFYASAPCAIFRSCFSTRNIPRGVCNFMAAPPMAAAAARSAAWTRPAPRPRAPPPRAARSAPPGGRPGGPVALPALRETRQICSRCRHNAHEPEYKAIMWPSPKQAAATARMYSADREPKPKVHRVDPESGSTRRLLQGFSAKVLGQLANFGSTL